MTDGPGICETRLGAGEAAQKMVRNMSEGVAQCPRGFHALAVVLKYPIRYNLKKAI